MNHQALRKYEMMSARFLSATPGMSWVRLLEIEAQGRIYPLLKLVLGEGNPKRALISAGIHGDEPAGVETLASALETGFFLPFLEQWEITLIPCINPTGYEAGIRENHAGIDLNRKFKEPDPPPEVSIIQSLFSFPYDIDLELHEDIDTPGYYLYQKEQGEISDLGRDILDAVSTVMPLNVEPEIEEMPAERGLLARLANPDEMEWWPMALYAFEKGCGVVFTLETSIQFPMATRIQAHLTALETALTQFDGSRIRP